MDEPVLGRTAGIDLAAQPAGTASCVLAWTAAGFWIEELAPAHVDDAEIVALMERHDIALVGIDVPLGWPDAYVRAVAGHQEGAWPFVEHDRGELGPQLRYRRTDRVLKEELTGARPLSPSLDTLAACVVRAAHLLARCEVEGTAIDREGLTGPVAEVYPAASGRVWSLTPLLQREYGGEPARERLRRIGPALADRLSDAGLVDGAEALDSDTLTLHGVDALLAALTARAVIGHATQHPAPDARDEASREGWLHWPTCSLDALLDLPYSPRT